VADDLSELLESALHAGTRELGDATPGEGAVPHWVRVVRRRRVVRHTVQAVIAVPVAAAVGVALWFGAGEALREGPVATPTPAPTVPPPTSDPTQGTTPSPTPDSTTETSPAPEEIVVPGLPPHFVAPDGVLSLASPGWVLSVYQVGDPEREWTVDVPRTLFLTSPDGDHFRLADVSVEWIEVHHWRAGDARARVTYGTYEDGYPAGHTTGWLDLLTGELTADERSLEWADFLGFAPDGDEVWYFRGGSVVYLVAPDGSRRDIDAADAGQTAVLSPAGTHVAVEGEDDGVELVLVDLGAQESRVVPFGVAGRSCSFTGWLDDVSLLVQCAVDNPGSTPRYSDFTGHRLTVVGGPGGVQDLGALLGSGRVVVGGANVEHDVVALRYWDYEALEAEPGVEACAPSAAVWLDGRVVDVPAFGQIEGRRSVSSMASHDGVLYLGGEYGCTFGEERPLDELARFDAVTGALTTVLPVIDFGGDLASRAGIGAVAGWVVAH